MGQQSKRRLLDDLEVIKIQKEVPIVSSCTIYKVPAQFRSVNPLAHTPSVVSIGPYHYGDSRLESMQEFKLWYFTKFLKRFQYCCASPYEKLFEAVKEKEDKIRQCYSENIDMDSYDFVRLVMFDAAFIIEFLSETGDTKPEGDTGSTTYRRAWVPYLMLDLILLENQIPFFVLEIFSNLANFPNVGFVYSAVASFFIKDIYPDDEEIVSKSWWLWRTFDCIRSSPKTKLDKRLAMFLTQTLPGNGPCHHLCDLLKILYGPSLYMTLFSKVLKRSYGASHLKDAGFKFKAGDNCDSILHVRRVDPHESTINLKCCPIGRQPSVLEIPRMKITNCTEILLRNVVALEQCHYPFQRFVTDYIILLDCLINTDKDVEILVEKGIFHSMVDNDKVAAMVNRLGDNVSASMGTSYSGVYKMLNEFYDNTCFINKSTFVREYWGTPWKKISLIGGIVLLLLTLIQAICSIFSL